MKHRKKQQETLGRRSYFTLIEMLTVMGILLILLTMGVMSMGSMFERSDIATAKAQVMILHTALEDYSDEKGNWPSEWTLIDWYSSGSQWSDLKLHTKHLDGLGFPWKKMALTIKYDNPDDKTAGGLVVDPWGNPYLYDNDGGNSEDYGLIFSTGPNGNVSFDLGSTPGFSVEQNNHNTTFLEDEDRIIILNIPNISVSGVNWYNESGSLEN